MTKTIQMEGIKEGDFFCKWLHSRLIRQNKNVIGVELGSTGSGKSYRDLRKAELWYEYHFKKPFPTENICFGVYHIMKRISSGELVKGDILIFEEAGVNLGSLDFQSKISKMFTYILQSFRSMNIALFMNLPYLSMLNKSARLLVHYSGESFGVDKNEQTNTCKFFLHQVSQRSGKIYPKYPIVNHKGIGRQLSRITYSIPSQYLIDAYETKKANYLSEITKEFTDKIKELEKENAVKDERNELTVKQLKVYELTQQGLNQTEIGKSVGICQQLVSDMLKSIKKKGYEIEIPNK